MPFVRPTCITHDEESDKPHCICTCMDGLPPQNPIYIVVSQRLNAQEDEEPETHKQIHGVFAYYEIAEQFMKKMMEHYEGAEVVGTNFEILEENLMFKCPDVDYSTDPELSNDDE